MTAFRVDIAGLYRELTGRRRLERRCFVLQAAAVKRNVAVKADWSLGSPENAVSPLPIMIFSAIFIAPGIANWFLACLIASPRYPDPVACRRVRQLSAVLGRETESSSPLSSDAFVRSCASTPRRSFSPGVSASRPPSTRTTVAPVGSWLTGVNGLMVTALYGGIYPMASPGLPSLPP